jgi:hypothetical protein
MRLNEAEMLQTRVSRCLILLTLFSAKPVSGQNSPSASIPIRELSAPTAATTEPFASITTVRALSDGRLLVNDPRGRQLILLDAQLRRTKAVLDSAPGTTQSYGASAPIIPYLGDSTLLVDIGAVSLSVINPDGTFGRVMAPPVRSEWGNLSISGAAHDARGNLVFRLDEKRLSTDTDDTLQLRKAFSAPDSFYVVRANFETQRFDTLGRVRYPIGSEAKIAVVSNRTVITMLDDPLPYHDGYAVLSDGSVAFVRGRDYHVDVISPTGQRITGPKLAFDWKRLTDADKQGIIDSVNAAKAARAAASAAAPTNRQRVSGVLGTSAATPRFVDRRERVFEVFDLTPQLIADYYPPLRAGAVKADMNANMWILPTTSAQSRNGELVYDVVNNRGVMMYRVRIPAGRSIAGFGKNGEVYLMSRNAQGWTIERTSIVQ